jgi:Domain of unknown function (DUF4136)
MPPTTAGNYRHHRNLLLSAIALLLTLLAAHPASSKMATDFNPRLDFSQYKTFAYIGGVESLVHLQLNPDLFNNRIHRAVVRELTAKGLREVQPTENPDLVVRYWLEADATSHLAAAYQWGIYGSYYGHYWTGIYTTMSTPVTHKGTLGIELIEAKSKDLAWRLYVSENIGDRNQDKIWKTADSNIVKAFKNYPPSPKAIEKKKAEWAKIDASPNSSQP